GSGGKLKPSNFWGAVHPRGNALGDAPRHDFAPHRTRMSGRRWHDSGRARWWECYRITAVT
ncbi:DUF1534 domain-containing protein, partial [Pseudomonas savastanoi]